MKGSLKIGAFTGISVYLHWTFALLIAWVVMGYVTSGKSLWEAMVGVAFVLALFGCVLLHEFGHALAARRYGVMTQDITLLPIGGVARLERIPEKPMQEFWVALAGPAVNVCIAAVLLAVFLVVRSVNPFLGVPWSHEHFLMQLMWVNLFIAAFNMLPAFPMDGGRILRSLLAIRMGRLRATSIAATIGQSIAVLLGLIGFFYNPFLIFIAMMVYLGAQAESSQVEMQTALDGLCVRDAMMTRFRTLAAGDSLAKAVEELLSGSQHDFPVLQDGVFVGVLRRDDLIKAISEGRSDLSIAEVMSRECEPVSESDILNPALETMNRNHCGTAPVLGGGRVVGLLTMENIGELVMLSASLDRVRKPAAAGAAAR